MKCLHQMIRLRTLLLCLACLFISIPVAAQETPEDVPSQINLAIANLSQRLRQDITFNNLTHYEWEHKQFPDTSLDCPSPGIMYTQVITPGYQFLLHYDGTVYDYRITDEGDSVVLCDTRPAMSDTPLPTQEPPTAVCGDAYTVQDGDTLIEIARDCNTSVAAMLAANPEIEDPSIIYENDVLTIPDGAQQRVVSIRPESGPPGTIVRVFASGFPAGAQVQLGLGEPESEYNVVASREIANDGELIADLRISPQIDPPDERVAVVVLDFEETVSEVFNVTEGQPITPTPTPTESPEGPFTRSQIYLVALEDAGRSGQEIGCGDSLIPVTVTFEPTVAPLTAALGELFDIDSRTYGQSGLYNALYQSDLTVEGIDIVDGEALIALTGTLQTGGICDTPRIIEQIKQTALQYSTIDRVSVSINGTLLEDLL